MAAFCSFTSSRCRAKYWTVKSQPAILMDCVSHVRGSAQELPGITPVSYEALTPQCLSWERAEQVDSYRTVLSNLIPTSEAVDA